jgi:branched-chain amino acid transport system permease protein
MVKAYIAAAIGGWGRVGGAALGAVMIALFEVFLPALPTLLPAGWLAPVGWLFSQTAAQIILYASLIAILAFRPMGLFGERVGLRA